MTQVLFGVFLVLHGLVHLLYAGLSRRLFESEGIGWTGRSWLLRRLAGEKVLGWLATLAYSAATVLFFAAGVAVVAGAGWARAGVAVAAAVSSLVVLVFWDGRVRKLADQGFIGVLIDAVLLASVLWLEWPFA